MKDVEEFGVGFLNLVALADFAQAAGGEHHVFVFVLVAVLLHQVANDRFGFVGLRHSGNQAEDFVPLLVLPVGSVEVL